MNTKEKKYTSNDTWIMSYDRSNRIGANGEYRNDGLTLQAVDPNIYTLWLGEGLGHRRFVLGGDSVLT